MINRQTLLVLLLLSLIIIDQSIKYYVFHGEVSWSSSVVEFSYFTSHGLSFDFFTNFDPVLRIILLNVIYAFCAMILLILIFIFFNRRDFFWLQTSLIIFLAGASGNTLDMICFGNTVEIFLFKKYFLKNVAFSFSELWIILGLLGLLINIILLNNKIWFENNVRELKIIDKEFQIPFSFMFSFMTFISGTVMGLFSFSLINIVIPDSNFKSEALTIFVIGWVLINLLLSFIAFIFGLILSHRTSGPLFALRTYILDFVEGSTSTFQLRQRDCHKEVLYEIVENLLKLKK